MTELAKSGNELASLMLSSVSHSLPEAQIGGYCINATDVFSPLERTDWNFRIIQLLWSIYGYVWQPEQLLERNGPFERHFPRSGMYPIDRGDNFKLHKCDWASSG